MGKFNDWFENKLKITRYPKPEEILKLSDIKYIINVSDEYNLKIHNICMEKNIKYFWFPMNECTDNMGINSIYGAMKILFIAEKENAKIIVHCHAGSNRSVTIGECYFYLRTKKYPIRKPRNKELDIAIESMFTFENEEDRLEYRRLSENSRLQNNIEMGHLPSKFKIESFLKQCEKSINNFSKFSLDTIKLNTNLQSY
jgi:hypothetical protein